jgi:hypothetical protein
MKKIIEGRVYNTETAKFLGSYQHSHRNDFSFYKEELYRTKSGAYFLYGEGGPASRYSKQVEQNRWTGGEEIRAMSPQGARAWAEEHLDADKYAEIFGEPEEAGDERVALNLTISAATKAKLEKMREDTGKSMSQIVEDMILAE